MPTEPEFSKRRRRDLAELETDPETSERLGRVRQKGTDAELRVRKAARELGLHYRLNNRDLPGSPDLANRRRRWAVFVHGCFWHRHDGCRRATTPKRNRDFWVAKFEANVARDERTQRALKSAGWRVVVIWECETLSSRAVGERIASLSDDTSGLR